MSGPSGNVYLQVSLRSPLMEGAVGPGLVEALADVFDRAEREVGGRICLSASGGDGGREAVGSELARLLLAAAARHGARRERRAQVSTQDAIWGEDGRCHVLAHVGSRTH